MAKAAVKSHKRAKPAKGKKRHRGVMDLPKAVETRMAEGRAERESVPLEAHGEWAASDGRPDPVGILEEQNTTRVPELVPIRHGRMIVSPFTFYRGGAAIMAADLSQTPSTGLRVQCCGDAHLSNSACSRRRIDASCSISTTSTRRCRRRSSGTSSASSRASSSPRATTATAARNSARPRGPPPRRTARR